MAAILAALPGRLGLAIVLPDERELARLQYIVKCSKSIRHSGGGQVEAGRAVPLLRGLRLYQLKHGGPQLAVVDVIAVLRIELFQKHSVLILNGNVLCRLALKKNNAIQHRELPLRRNSERFSRKPWRIPRIPPCPCVSTLRKKA